MNKVHFEIILKNIYIKGIFKFAQYHYFYCMFDQINAALANILANVRRFG